MEVQFRPGRIVQDAARRNVGGQWPLGLEGLVPGRVQLGTRQYDIAADVKAGIVDFEVGRPVGHLMIADRQTEPGDLTADRNPDIVDAQTP